MNKIRCLLTIVLLGLCSNLVFAQSDASPYLDEESNLALQAVPIYEGVDAFRARIEKVRKEEKREPLGLVLTGGSARAFCHVGVLKAMEENGIVPDFIIANSMGAIIGSLYAYGFSPEKIEEIISKITLSKYFETVMPVHGGMISVRKYEALINMLLAEESHDLKDAAIPVLLLTEDLNTKRQIWHSEGDFASIMNAAFAMSFFMEPVDYTLSDGTKVKLIDSGSVDIAGMKIARSFSSNLIISTAFYDADIDLNNPIVILNRTFSIGKERVAISDILNFKPLVIRNDVEHFSFMDFQKAAEITQAGYESANKVMASLVKAPHGSKVDKEWRARTSELADNLMVNINNNEPMKSARPYFGVRIWPEFGVTDFPDSYLFDMYGVGISAYEDVSSWLIKGQINIPFSFKEARAEALIRYNPSGVFMAELFGSYGISYSGFEGNNLFVYSGLNFCPKFFPDWMKSVYLTGEMTADNKMNITDVMLASGVKFDFGNPLSTFFYFKPFGFVAGDDFKSLHIGAGAEMQSSWNIFKHFGVGEYATVRYAGETKLYTSDFYRADATTQRNDLVASSASEIYFFTPSTGFTFSEFLIFQQLKAGAFFDYTWTGSNSFCTGGFVRTDVSLIGLADFILEAGGGYDFTAKKPFGYFEMKNRM